jgi:DNA-binding XRE family transcriptional regulator
VDCESTIFYTGPLLSGQRAGYGVSMTGKAKLGLRGVRRAQGKTLRGVARRAQVDPSHLSRIERGLATPSLDTLVAICRELGLRNVVDALNGLEDG